MMNNKLVKLLALAMILVCSAMMLASCVTGSTKEDKKGDESVIESLVPEKDDIKEIPWEG